MHGGSLVDPWGFEGGSIVDPWGVDGATITDPLGSFIDPGIVLDGKERA